MTTRDQINRILTALDLSGAGSSDFDLNPDLPPSKAHVLRDAAVLVPLVETTNGIDVVLTKRASNLKHHPGQIAFPGGKRDDGDVSLVATALREADEEIGLRPDNVEILGQLPAHHTVTNFAMTPVVGMVRTDFTITPSTGEVSEVFHVPLTHLMDVGRYQIQSRRWRGVWRSYYTVPFGPYYVWGATARVLYGLAERMNR
jgi:8-oxo-dGTP pyrophosphatase MutT (NUDIX family)